MRIGRSWLALLAFAAACPAASTRSAGGNGTTTPSVTVSPPWVALLPLATATFLAQVAGTDDHTVSWSIQETSGCGSITPGGSYTAPNATTTCHVIATLVSDTSRTGSATVQVRTSGGIQQSRPFAANSPWNTPTPAGTRWYDTPVLHSCNASACTADHVRHWWVTTDFGITWASPSDPIWTFNLAALNAAAWHRVRPAATLQARAPATLTPLPADDRIICVVNVETGDYIEAWAATVNAGARTASDGGSWATGNIVTGLGVGDLATNQNAGVRASNFSWAAGLITAADVSQGRIDHALVVALPAYANGDSMIAGSPTGPGPYRAPATCGNSQLGSGPIVMGSKIGIPAGVARPAGLSPIGIMVFDALQTYGAYVGDGNGGAMPAFYADGPSLGIPRGAAPDSTIFEPLVAYWNHGGTADMERIGPLLRVADYQP